MTPSLPKSHDYLLPTSSLSPRLPPQALSGGGSPPLRTIMAAPPAKAPVSGRAQPSSRIPQHSPQTSSHQPACGTAGDTHPPVDQIRGVHTSVKPGKPTAAGGAAVDHAASGSRGLEGSLHTSVNARQMDALMRDVAARIIQTYWRTWKAWRSKVRGREGCDGLGAR